jgi:hypothetical protein
MGAVRGGRSHANMFYPSRMSGSPQEDSIYISILFAMFAKIYIFGNGHSIRLGLKEPCLVRLGLRLVMLV